MLFVASKSVKLNVKLCGVADLCAAVGIGIQGNSGPHWLSLLSDPEIILLLIYQLFLPTDSKTVLS